MLQYQVNLQWQLILFLIGYLDVVCNRTVAGWGYDPNNPDRRVGVQIFVNGSSTGFVVADKFRHDIVGSCHGDGNHGYTFYIPDNIAQIRTVEARFVDSGQLLLGSNGQGIDETTNRPLPDEWVSEKGGYALPSVFLLGAAKSGTSSLHNYLGQCADICVSNPKEPYYFEYEYEAGATFYFNKYFSHWHGQKLVVDARHRNLYLPWVPERIKAHNPSARLLVILRNPVQRAISHWWHWYSASRAFEPLNLKEALAADLRRIESERTLTVNQKMSSYAAVLLNDMDGANLTHKNEARLRTYLDSGYYMEQIDRYLQFFPRDQLHVLLLDDLIVAPQKTFASILEFLGLNPDFAKRIRYPVCNTSMPGKSEQLDASILSWLHAHYESHNRTLEGFLGRSLNTWSSCAAPLADYPLILSTAGKLD